VGAGGRGWLRPCALGDHACWPIGGIEPNPGGRDPLGCGLAGLPGLKPERLPRAQAAPPHQPSWWQMNQGPRCRDGPLVQALWRQELGGEQVARPVAGQARDAVLAAMGTAPSRAVEWRGAQPWPWLAIQDLAAVPAGFERAAAGDGHRFPAGRVKSPRPPGVLPSDLRSR